MNSLNVKAKFQIGRGEFKSLKQIFCKFVGQSDFEGQGQGHKFLEHSKTFICSMHRSSSMVKFIMVQKLLHSQRITQKFYVPRPI